MESIKQKAETAQEIEDVINLYAEVSELMKMLKEIKDNMRERISVFMTDSEETRLENDMVTVGFTSPSIKTVVDEAKWEDFLKKDLELAKYETQREIKRLEFLIDVTPDPSLYIRLKR